MFYNKNSNIMKKAIIQMIVIVKMIFISTTIVKKKDYIPKVMLPSIPGS